MISKVGISVDPSKVEAMVDWARPMNVSEVEAFWALLAIIGGLWRDFPILKPH